MKARIEITDEGENLITYLGGDEFDYPGTFRELSKCENVIMGVKINPIMRQVFIDGKEYTVMQQKTYSYGFVRKMLFAD